MKTIAMLAAFNVAILVAGYAHAAPRHKTEFQVAFVAAGHLVYHDERLSLRAAEEECSEMNRLREDDGAHHFVIVAPEEAK